MSKRKNRLARESHKFVEPESREEAVERLQRASEEVIVINAQLRDCRLRDSMSVTDYEDWRSRAAWALAHFGIERQRLEAWLSEHKVRRVAEEQKLADERKRVRDGYKAYLLAHGRKTLDDPMSLVVASHTLLRTLMSEGVEFDKEEIELIEMLYVYIKVKAEESQPVMQEIAVSTVTH